MDDALLLDHNAIDILEFKQISSLISKHSSFSLGQQIIENSLPKSDHLWVNNALLQCGEAITLVIELDSIKFDTLVDTTPFLQACKKDITLSATQCFRIAKNIDFNQVVINYLKQAEKLYASIQDLVTSLIDQRELAKAIYDCLDGYGDIKESASLLLGALSKEQKALESELSSMYQQFVNKHVASLMEIQVSWRNNRRCVLVKETYKNQISGIIHGESTSGQSFYIEPTSMIERNNQLAQITAQIEEEHQRILFALSQKIKAEDYACMANLSTLALLDAIFAKAKWAIEYDGCVANMGGTTLSLKDAYHPLISLDSVVRNDYRLTPTHKCMLISGSNTGGKTVSLKSIGLCIAMSMAGFPICANDAKIPWYNHLYIDIGDCQSIKESLSTFSSHMVKLADICQHAQANDFVLVDELGSGSDPLEGEALAFGILETLKQRNVSIIATTHYNALKQLALKDEAIICASVEFDTNNMQPTYRFLQGSSGASYAFEIAKRCGISDDIVDLAHNFKKQQQDLIQADVEKLEKAKLEVELQKKSLDEKLVEIAQYQQALALEHAQLKMRKASIFDKYEDEAQAWLEQQRLDMQAKINEINEQLSEPKSHLVAKSKHDLSTIEIEERVLKEQEVMAKFEINDYVEILPYHYFGDIMAINKKNIVVFANSMKMNVHLSDLQHALRPKKVKRSPHSVKAHTSFKSELNIVGERVEEALVKVDQFLDNALLQNASEVKIIHGVGTLALRKGVRDFLKHKKFVKNVENGGQGDGGLGVSIVVLRLKE